MKQRSLRWHLAPKNPTPPRTGKGKRPELSLAELREKLNLTIPEAMRLTGYGRQRIETLLEQDEWEWYPEGSQTRIITASIIDYQTRKAQAHREERRAAA